MAPKAKKAAAPIGSGAGENPAVLVAMVPGVKLKGGWELGEELGRGAFGRVFAGRKAGETEYNYAIKLTALEPARKGKLAQSKEAILLNREFTVFNNVGKHSSLAPPVPNGYHDDQGVRFLVFPRLGETFEAISRKKGGIPVRDVVLFWLQALDVLQFVHKAGYMYRDIKLANFMTGRGATANTVYLIDFGCTERARTFDGQRKEASENGTPAYFSLNTHNGIPPAERDDIESLGYAVIELAKGRLPWTNSGSAAELLRLKTSTTIPALTAGLPSCFAKYLTYIRGLANETPIDYAMLRDVIAAEAPASRVFSWNDPSYVGAPFRAANLTGGIVDTKAAESDAGANDSEDEEPAPKTARRTAARTTRTPAKPRAASKTPRRKAAAPVEDESDAVDLVDVSEEEPAAAAPRRRTTRSKTVEAAPTVRHSSRLQAKAATVVPTAEPSDNEDEEEEQEVVPARRPKRTAAAAAVMSPQNAPSSSRKSPRKARVETSPQQCAPEPITSSQDDEDPEAVENAQPVPVQDRQVSRLHVVASAAATLLGAGVASFFLF